MFVFNIDGFHIPPARREGADQLRARIKGEDRNPRQLMNFLGWCHAWTKAELFGDIAGETLPVARKLGLKETAEKIENEIRIVENLRRTWTDRESYQPYEKKLDLALANMLEYEQYVKEFRQHQQDGRAKQKFGHHLLESEKA